MTSIAWTYPSIIESEDRMLTVLAAFLEESDVDLEKGNVAGDGFNHAGPEAQQGIADGFPVGVGRDSRLAG